LGFVVLHFVHRFIILIILFNRKEHREDAEDRKALRLLCELLGVLRGFISAQ